MIKSFQINIFSLRLYSCSLLLQGFFQLLNKDANNCANVFNVGTGYDHKIWMFSIIWLCLLPSLNKLFNHFLCLKYQLKQEKKRLNTEIKGYPKICLSRVYEHAGYIDTIEQFILPPPTREKAVFNSFLLLVRTDWTGLFRNLGDDLHSHTKAAQSSLRNKTVNCSS